MTPEAAAAPPVAPLLRVHPLPLSVPRSGVSDVARLALRQLLGDDARELADAFHRGVPIDALLCARSDAVERVVAHVWRACLGDAAPVALYAVGGFGRIELFPHSDVDLLALCAAAPPASTQRALEAFFTCLWDIGLKPGHALRTLAECRSLAAGDATIFTSLLDARRIAGVAQLDTDLAAMCRDAEIWPPARYLAAKIAESEQRYARFDDTAYSLEPNIKDGPGGLRTLHLIGWLGRRLFGATTPAALIESGLLSAAEAETAGSARRLLSRIRFALHLNAGRAEERLLFDYQRTLAAQFGFSDEHGRNLAVEQFMQGYYRAAIATDRLGDRFLQRCAERLESDGDPRIERLSLDFVAVDGRLDCDPPDLLVERPGALIDLFRVWGEHPRVKGLRTDLARRIEQALQRSGSRLADDADVNAAFARLLRKGAAAVEAIARMNRYGVLAQYLPAFGRVVGRMQYDLFHMYTVDEHTMRVLRNVARFANPETCCEFAHAHEVWQRLAKPELLLLAALFHDIAKGRGGDHSELGAVDARDFCMRLGLSEADVDAVAWLVRRHLLMSVTAQRQDITDPQTVHRFALEVADRERLDYLYLLTVADIAGTSTKLWNSWKDQLLSELYVSTRYVLRSGMERPPHAAERVRDCQRQARALLRARSIGGEIVEKIWADFPQESFLRFAPEEVAWQTAAIAEAGDSQVPLVRIQPQGPRGVSEVLVHAPDRDGLFAAITAVLERMRLSVHDARIVTLRSGMSLDSFMVLDSNGHALSDTARIQRLQRALVDALSQQPYPAELRLRPSPRPLRHFHIAPRLVFEDVSGGRTQLALVCSDRPGLLARVARVFRECGVRVHDARIATFGERVEDFFLLSDERDAPLEPTSRATLHEALMRQLETNDPAGEKHAIA